jgi:hypothetical protein
MGTILGDVSAALACSGIRDTGLPEGSKSFCDDTDSSDRAAFKTRLFVIALGHGTPYLLEALTIIRNL